MRCIALGQAWVDAGRHQAAVRDQKSDVSLSSDLCPTTSVVFICAEIPEALAMRIKSEGFDLIRINAEPGSSDDLNQTLDVVSGLPLRCPAFAEPSSPTARFRSQVSGLKCDSLSDFRLPSSVLCPLSSFPSGRSPQPSPLTSLWLVLDGYHFNLDYQRGIRAAGHKLVLIDDYNHLAEYECDILLNQNINATDLDYHTNSEAKRLLGTQYALLRREFKRGTGFQPVQRDSNGEVGRKFPDIARNILVTLGGADPDNVTLKVIQALNQVDIPDMQVKVVVGSANPHIASLETVLQHSTSNIQLINSADMAELMAWADLAISAAGSTCWEFCYLGVPLMTIILAENQVGLAGRLEKNGASKNMGWHNQIDVVGFAEEIYNLLNNEVLRNSLSCHALNLVDGRGSFRVVEIINGG